MSLYFSLYLFKLGLAPLIQDLYGKVDFTGMAPCRETWAGGCQGGLPPMLWGPMAGGMWGVQVLDEFCQSCLRDAHPSVEVFCTPLGLAGEWGLCWLPLL